MLLAAIIAFLLKLINKFLGLTFIILVILKLVNAVTISWWLVFAPLLIQMGMLLFVSGMWVLRENTMSPFEKAMRNYYHAVTGKNDWH